MKNLYTSKKFQKLTFLFAALLSMGLIMNSCKKDEDTDPYTDHAVGFVVMSIPGGPPSTPGAPTGVKLQSVTTQIGTESTPILFPNNPSDPVVTMWTGGPDVAVSSSKSAVYLSANGRALDPHARLITQIYIDGELKKTDTAKATGNGTSVVSQVKYSFIGLQ